MALSDGSASMPSGFSDGIELEETFPETPAPQPAPARAEASPAARSESAYQEQLERRLREAEEMVKQTVERMRFEEEQRLAEWVRQRREEEERRVQRWVEERRAALERALDQRRTAEEGLANRLQEMLGEWERRFEDRLEQRRAEDERSAERRRQSDEERLKAWRVELEQALAERFDRERASRAPLPDRNGELRAAVRDAITASTSVRDVGRVLRDVLAELVRTSAFALAVHQAARPEVAYRYRVASEDELGQLLRSGPLDDGPRSAAANADGWVRAQRTERVAERNITVHAAHIRVVHDGAVIGVLTLQTEDHAVADAILARVRELTGLAAPHLAQLREAGRFRGV